MLRVLPKSTLRKFELMQFLNNSEKFLEVNKIAAFLKCSERTVHEDIQELRESNVKNMFDFQLRNKQYSVRFKNNVSMDAIGHYIMENNDCFQIIEYVFFHSNCSIDEILDEFHISLPTFYRIVSRINQSLNHKFNLQFKTNPCVIIGDELEVRGFYLQYFAERYPVKTWPFKDIDEEALIIFLTNITATVNFKFNISNMRNVKMSLAVSRIRYEAGYKVGIQNNQIREIYSYLSQMDEMEEYFKNTFNIDSELELVEDLFSYALRDYYFFNYEHMLKSAVNDKYVSASYVHLNNMLNDISVKYKIPLDNKEALVLNLHNTAQLGSSEINAKFLIIDNKKILLNQFKEKFSVIYEDVKEQLVRYNTMMNLSVDHYAINHLVYTLYTHWKSLVHNLYLMQRKVNIRVVSANDSWHARMMRDLISFEFSDQAEVNLIKNYDIDAYLATDPNFDILVTNFTYKNIPGRYVIAINDAPSADDLNVINEAIQDIYFRDNNHLN